MLVASDHFVAKLFLLTVALFTIRTLPQISRAEDPTPQFRVAMDPRVHDAVQLWLEWIEYQAAINRIPGVSVGIVYDQELVASAAFGLANPQENLAAAPDTLYSICSISKLFTAVAVPSRAVAQETPADSATVEIRLPRVVLDGVPFDAWVVPANVSPGVSRRNGETPVSSS